MEAEETKKRKASVHEREERSTKRNSTEASRSGPRYTITDSENQASTSSSIGNDTGYQEPMESIDEIPGYIQLLLEKSPTATMTDVSRALEYWTNNGRSILLDEDEELPAVVLKFIKNRTAGTLKDIPRALEYMTKPDFYKKKELPEYVKAYKQTYPEESSDNIKLAMEFMEKHGSGTASKSRQFCFTMEHLKAMRELKTPTNARGLPADVTPKDLERHYEDQYMLEDIQHVSQVFKTKYGFIPDPILFGEHYTELKGIVYVEKQNESLQKSNTNLSQKCDKQAREIDDLKEELAGLKSQSLCKICMNDQVSIAYLPCRHFAVCINCDAVLRGNGFRCPICRGVVDHREKYFL